MPTPPPTITRDSAGGAKPTGRADAKRAVRTSGALTYAVKQMHYDRPYTLVGTYLDAALAVRTARASACEASNACLIEASEGPADWAKVYPEGDYKGAYYASALRSALDLRS